MNRKIIRNLFAFLFVLSLLTVKNTYVEAKQSSFEIHNTNIVDKQIVSQHMCNVIPEEATKFAYNHYQDLIEVVRCESNYYNIDKTDLNDLSLGNPFVIYDVDNVTQDEIYYYPLNNKSGKTILLLSVIGTTEGWTISTSQEYVKSINEIGMSNDEYIVYTTNGNLYVESPTQLTCTNKFKKGVDKFRKEFCRKNYKQKKDQIINEPHRYRKADIVAANKSFSFNKKSTYTPSFSESTNTRKICALYNEKGQGNYGLCWAASVATIVNYRKGTNITAKNVANKIGVGYNAGGTIGQSQMALQCYDIIYNNLNYDASAKMSWSNIMLNINNKFPFQVHFWTSDAKDKHAVTVYGYRTVSLNDYISVWNSGTQESAALLFKPSGTVLPYNGKNFIWKYSLSKY